MKLLADENISGVLVEELRACGIDTVWVKKDYRGISDDAVIAIASAEGRFILTSDKGFGEQVFRGGRRVGVILLRLYDLKADELVDMVSRIITRRDDWDHYFTVIDSKRVRMIALPTH
ncbi:MAG TPA: DUF5615 family PIN-like protein [Thermoanaerobaculia bacterium]|jgi:predicted nuclease of predicted toxin-antitoxin system|nr:DUF5615 family PIN-like protein [Thermoanaerobaculia bacterium]